MTNDVNREQITGRDRRNARRAAWGIYGGGLAVALLMVLSPLAAASSVTPPYKGVVASPSTSWGYSGCGKAAVLTSTKWSSFTGVVSFAGKTNAKSGCKSLGSVGGSGSANVYGNLNLAIPVKLPNGQHSVQPNWTIAYSAFQHFTILRSCPAPVVTSTGYSSKYCNVQAGFNFNMYSYMYDTTNNTYYGSSTYFPYIYNYSYQYNDTYCYSGSCNYYNYSYGGPAIVSASMPFTSYFNGTFVSSHAYVIYTYLYFSVNAYAYGYKSASASAFFAMHNGTVPTQLNSINII